MNWPKKTQPTNRQANQTILSITKNPNFPKFTVKIQALKVGMKLIQVQGA